MADLMVGIVTKGDFSKACDVVVYKTPDGQHVRVDNSPELREQCAQSTAAMFGQGQAESGENKGISEHQAKTLFPRPCSTFQTTETAPLPCRCRFNRADLTWSRLKMAEFASRLRKTDLAILEPKIRQRSTT